ncbi:MAG: YfcC family protein [Pseudomonadota bacterium]
MSDVTGDAAPEQSKTPPDTGRDLADRFPSAFTILFVLILIMGALTWILPAGQYDRAANEALGKDAPVPGTYHEVEAAPQGLIDALMAPIAGFYDPVSYGANAIDVSLFVLVIGGFLGVVNRTGAIDTAIAGAMARMRGREHWMIPVLMTLFALGGTTYGMAEETLAFYALLIPVVILAGYDAVTAVAIILVGAGVGVLGSTINPFATTIASNAAGVSFTSGIWLRLVLLLGGLAICILYVMRYAARVKADPSRSVVADRRVENEAYFLKNAPEGTPSLTLNQTMVLVLFGLTFAVMIWGVSVQGWWMAEMSALFLGASIVIGTVAWLGEKPFIAAFVDGARDLLGVALIIGLARGIVVIMEAGKISDTILFASEQAIAGYSSIAFILGLYWIEVLLSFLVPSTSGLAVLSMPILAPLADFAGVSRELTVTAYQSAAGIVNLVTPTSAVVVGALAIGRVPYDRWLRFIAPLLLILTIFVMAVLALGAVL